MGYRAEAFFSIFHCKIILTTIISPKNYRCNRDKCWKNTGVIEQNYFNCNNSKKKQHSHKNSNKWPNLKHDVERKFDCYVEWKKKSIFLTRKKRINARFFCANNESNNLETCKYQKWWFVSTEMTHCLVFWNFYLTHRKKIILTIQKAGLQHIIIYFEAFQFKSSELKYYK